MEAKITVTRRETALNAWTMVTAEVDGKIYLIKMVRFEEPSIYGIRKGRISKLWGRGEDGTVVIGTSAPPPTRSRRSWKRCAVWRSLQCRSVE